MIDDPQDVANAFALITINPDLAKGLTTPMTEQEPRLDALLRDVIIQANRIRNGWRGWDIETRHDAVNELHCRAQEANVALLDAVRLSDFQATP